MKNSKHPSKSAIGRAIRFGCLIAVLIAVLSLGACNSFSRQGKPSDSGGKTSSQPLFDASCDCKANCLYLDNIYSQNEIIIIDTLRYGAAPNWALGTGKMTNLYLTLQYPEVTDFPGGRPLWINVHGGGFKDSLSNSVSGYPPIPKTGITTSGLAQKGYVFVDLGYRLGWSSELEECNLGGSPNETGMGVAEYQAVQDLISAIHFLTLPENAKRYGIDPTKVFLRGGSAGANTILTTAFYDQAYVDTFFHQFPFIDTLGSLDPYGLDRSVIRGVAPTSGNIGAVGLLKNRDIPVVFAAGTCDARVGWYSSDWTYCGWDPSSNTYVPREKELFAARTLADSLWTWNRQYVLYSVDQAGHMLKGLDQRGINLASAWTPMYYFRKVLLGCEANTAEPWAIANDILQHACPPTRDTFLIQPFPIYPGPAHGIMNKDKAELAWQNVPFANVYQIQVASDREFQNMIFNKLIKEESQLKMDTLICPFQVENQDLLFWRVRALYQGSGKIAKNSAWSNVAAFRKESKEVARR